MAELSGAKTLADITPQMSTALCTLFNADRLTIYSVGDDKTSIVSRIKTGLTSFRDLKLPIGEHSLAGYVALSKQMLNVRDAYDEAELRRHNARLRLLQEVDRRTGYRTKQMLVAPVLDTATMELLGVIQLINHRADASFDAAAEQALIEVCRTLAGVLRRPPVASSLIHNKYEHLVQSGLITAGAFEEAARTARKNDTPLETILLSEHKLKLADLGAALAKYFGVAYEPFKPERIKPLDLVRNLRREYVTANGWLPIDDGRSGVTVLTLDPERIKASRIVGNVLQKQRVVYCVTTLREFAQTIDQFFGTASSGGDLGDLLSDLDDDEGLVGEEINEDALDNELVKLVNKVIMDACQQQASDIHIESYPGRGRTEIRFRRDGTLMPYTEVPASYRNALIARIKIMCDLDISERRKPQDGKIKFKRFGPLDVELRVATIPTAGGVEDVVMRVLAAGEPIALDKLALSQRNFDTLKDLVSKPYGLFFVCGPTGSGKTTTLHSVLGHLNTPETKIWTAEDPVEITQKGLRQVQVNRKAGLDFATVMKSFLRADPDIIMVGEMRDKETTQIGVEASLTGHLVLATLHTNSAPESIVRLLDMGMDPFNFADALIGVLAQRLAKRLCSTCKEAYAPSGDEIRSLLNEYCQELTNTSSFQRDPKAGYEKIYAEWVSSFSVAGKGLVLYKRVGCEACGKTGYKGRVGLHELLVGSDTQKRLIQEKARVAEMLATALEEGMRTLKMDGIEKVLAGVTDMAQVRVVCIK